jgi:pimeloyl-ACP methyl ester carboxylesterase
MSIPVHDPVVGNADFQEECFARVNATSLPVHFVWGTNDNVFTTEWGKKWHSMIPHSTWNEVPAGHFLQDTHGEQIVRFVLDRAAGA